MAVIYKCDSCGAVEEIAVDGDQDSGDAIVPPSGWREICTVISEFDAEKRIKTHAGLVLHSCADCNAHMRIDEHHEAELAVRMQHMAYGLAHERDMLGRLVGVTLRPYLKTVLTNKWQSFVLSFSARRGEGELTEIRELTLQRDAKSADGKKEALLS